MQRVVRDEGYTLVDQSQPAHRQALIHRYCPPSIGNLFATPREGRNGSVEWWTELTGQPRRLADLTSTEQAELNSRLTQLLTALGHLITELERRGDPAAEELRTLPTQPGADSLYSINGEPLLIRWAPVRALTTPAVSASPASATAPTRPAPEAPLKRQRRWLVTIVLPLLLGSLALLAVWLVFDWSRFSLPWPQSQAGAEPAVSRDRAEPMLGTGDVQVTLRWNSSDDLDLAVTDPNGDTALFSHPYTLSGGQLDVDSNAGCTAHSPSPVENIFWRSGNAPEGVFIATVSLYARCNSERNPIPFELTITLDGNTETRTGTVNAPSPSQSFEFVFP